MCALCSGLTTNNNRPRRGGVMKWSEFKSAVDEAIDLEGASGDIEVDWIDCHAPSCKDHIECGIDTESQRLTVTNF